MPAVKRFDAKFTFPVTHEQVAWLRQQAAERSLSAADVLRELIDAERRKGAHQS